MFIYNSQIINNILNYRMLLFYAWSIREDIVSPILKSTAWLGCLFFNIGFAASVSNGKASQKIYPSSALLNNVFVLFSIDYAKKWVIISVIFLFLLLLVLSSSFHGNGLNGGVVAISMLWLMLLLYLFIINFTAFSKNNSFKLYLRF